MKCRYCDSEIVNNATSCPYCGCPTDEDAFKQSPYAQPEKKYVGIGILGFFFPLVGIIIGIVCYRSNPTQSRAAIKGAIIGVVVVAVELVMIALFGPQFLEALREKVAQIR